MENLTVADSWFKMYESLKLKLCSILNLERRHIPYFSEFCRIILKWELTSEKKNFLAASTYFPQEVESHSEFLSGNCVGLLTIWHDVKAREIFDTRGFCLEWKYQTLRIVLKVKLSMTVHGIPLFMPSRQRRMDGKIFV